MNFIILFFKIVLIFIFTLTLLLASLFVVLFFKTKEKRSVTHFIKAFFLESFIFFLFFPLIRIYKKLLPQKIQEGSSHLPVLFIHGYRMNSSCWIYFIDRMKRWGCHVTYTFDYSDWKTIEQIAFSLKARVEEILEKENKSQINIVAHSLGGIIARYYIEKIDNKISVRHLVTIGTPHQGNRLTRLAIGKAIRQIGYQSEFIKNLGEPSLSDATRYFAIHSLTDEFIIPTETAKVTTLDSPQIEHFSVSGIGHLSLLFSKKIVETVFERVMERKPNEKSLKQRGVDIPRSIR